MAFEFKQKQNRLLLFKCPAPGIPQVKFHPLWRVKERARWCFEKSRGEVLQNSGESDLGCPASGCSGQTASTAAGTHRRDAARGRCRWFSVPGEER